MKTITFVEQVCPECGTTFQMDETLAELREKDGDTFYCPNGCGQSYGDTDAEQIDELRAQLAAAKTELADQQTENRRLRCQLLGQPAPRPSLLRLLRQWIGL